MNFHRLILEHDAIGTCTRRLSYLCTGSPDPPRATVALSDLSLLVGEHLRHEDRTVYQPLLDARVKGQASHPVDLEASFQDLRRDCEQYFGEWSREMITTDWASFVTETTDILGRLRDRVRTETELIYPLALQAGTICLRDEQHGHPLG